jgi:long-chain acyl-CoA synthetase
MARLRGDAPFLIQPRTGATVTFAQLQRDSRALTGRLSGWGLLKGDRVALLLENGPCVAELLIGTLYAGLVPVPLSIHAGHRRIVSTLKHSGSRALFMAPGQQARLESDLASDGPVRLVRVDPDHRLDWGDHHVPTADLVELDGDDDAFLVYTSGTTGQPKAVLLTQRAIVAAAANVVEPFGLSAADRALCVLPLSQRSAQNATLLASLLSGGAVVLPRRFEVTAFWELVSRHRCTWFGLVPALISQLLSRPAAPEAAAARAHVRFARSSSAPLAPALLHEFETRFDLPLLEGMGQTEAGSTIFSNRLPPSPRKAGSVGTSSGFEVKVVDDGGRALPPGSTGEILVRGPSVMKEYYRDPAATAEVLTPDGWLRTGDLGHQDEDGYIFLTGRAREVINRGGVKVAPREIDDVLLRHPAVLDAAAAGVPDAYLGHDVVAWVVLRPGTTCAAGDLLTLCDRALGQLRSPTRIHFVEALPRGPSGKVRRGELTEETARSGPWPGGGPRARPHRPVNRHVPPRTPIERVLCEAWGAVLAREPIGIHDEFFELGGDSLQAMRILTRLSGSLPVSLSFDAFFAHPTVAEQAQLLDDALLDRVGDETALRLLEELERLPDSDVAGRLPGTGRPGPSAG